MLIALAVLFLPAANGSDRSESFSQKYEALKPRENSSVQSDYLFEQISLGSEYTVILLDELNLKSMLLDQKADSIIERLDKMIEQQQRIIELLEKQGD